MHLVRGPCTTYKPPVRLSSCWLVYQGLCVRHCGCSRFGHQFPSKVPPYCAGSRCGWRLSPACHLLYHSTILYDCYPSIVLQPRILLLLAPLLVSELSVPWSVSVAYPVYPAMFINLILHILYFGHASLGLLLTTVQYPVHLTQTNIDKQRNWCFLTRCIIVQSITSRFGLRSMSPPRATIFLSSSFPMPSSLTKAWNQKIPHLNHAYSPQRETHTPLPVLEIRHPHTGLSKQQSCS